MQLALGNSTTFHAVSHVRSTGASADLNAVPVLSIFPDAGAALAYSPTAVKIRTGHYRVTVAHTTGNGFVVDTWYNLSQRGVDAVDTDIADSVISGRFELKGTAWFDVRIGDSLSMHFRTRVIATGDEVDADSTPTVESFEDAGDADIGGVTVANKATGVYVATIAATTANGYEAGKTYNIVATAVIGGVTSREVIGMFKLRAVAAASDIETALYSRLTGDAGVFAIIGARMFPHRVPQQSNQFPCIVYDRTSGEHIRSLAGSSGAAWPRYQLQCWALSYSEAKALGEAVRSALDGFSGTVGTVVINSCLLEDDSDTVEIPPGKDEQRRWAVEQVYKIWHVEVKPTLS